MLYNCNSSDGWLLKHNGDLTEVWRTRPERTMSGVVRGMAESSVPVGSWLWRGESGRNELLRGPFALFGVRNSAKLVRDLAKHRRTPMSPPQLIPPTSPVQVIAGTEDSGGGFRGTGHGPFRALIVSNLKWGGPCRDHYVFPAGRYQIFHNSLIKVH